MKIAAIYKIENSISHKFYIGSTIDFYSRKRKHLSDLRLNKHCNLSPVNIFYCVSGRNKTSSGFIWKYKK